LSYDIVKQRGGVSAAHLCPTSRKHEVGGQSEEHVLVLSIAEHELTPTVQAARMTASEAGKPPK
jgi:hypothetical protein